MLALQQTIIMPPAVAIPTSCLFVTSHPHVFLMEGSATPRVKRPCGHHGRKDASGSVLTNEN